MNWKQFKRKLSHPLEYFLTLALVRLFQSLPHELALRCGDGIGRFAFSVIRMRRRIVLANLRAALPAKSDHELGTIARDTYRNFAMSLVEFARLPVTTPEEMRQRIRIEGLENFEKARARSRGAVLVTGHFGSWELMGASFIAYGYPVNFLVGEQTNSRVDDLMNEIRESRGIGIIKMGASMRKVLKALKNNEFVAMLSDQDAGQNGVFVDFLGRSASTPFGPASFALRTNATIITGFIVREGRAHHRVILQEPVIPVPTDNHHDDLVRYTQAYTNALERYVREYPDHWLWLHRRWKTKP